MATVHGTHSTPIFIFYPLVPIFQGGLLSVDSILAVTAPLRNAVASVVGSAAIRVAGTISGQLEFDIDYWTGSAWASIFSTLPTIAYGSYYTNFTPNITSFAAGTYFRAEITELSGGVTEEDLTIQLFGAV